MTSISLCCCCLRPVVFASNFRPIFRNEQYQWILKALGLWRPHNITFSPVNCEYTALSKRKLTWFLENGYVNGWDDPSMWSYGKHSSQIHFRLHFFRRQ